MLYHHHYCKRLWFKQYNSDLKPITLTSNFSLSSFQNCLMMIIGNMMVLITGKTIVPEVHIKCKVHELFTDFWHRQDIERDAHRYGSTAVHWSHTSVVINLSRGIKDKNLVSHCLLLLTPKLLRRALMSMGGTWCVLLRLSWVRRGVTRQASIVHQITAADFQWENNWN